MLKTATLSVLRNNTLTKTAQDLTLKDDTLKDYGFGDTLGALKGTALGIPSGAALGAGKYAIQKYLMDDPESDLLRDMIYGGLLGSSVGALMGVPYDSTTADAALVGSLGGGLAGGMSAYSPALYGLDPVATGLIGSTLGTIGGSFVGDIREGLRS